MKKKIFQSIKKLNYWLEKNDYKGYDPFDGLNSKILRLFTYNNKILNIALQQSIRRFPINLRPILGIKKNHSSKGMGFLSKGYISLYEKTGNEEYSNKAKHCLEWLIKNQNKGYSGACWGNHFDYQSRVFYLPKNVPTIVWVSLIGHAFLDAYECLKNELYLETAVSACEHIINDLGRKKDGKDVCISYIPFENIQVHNANVLGAGFLARTYATKKKNVYRDLAEKAVNYTIKYQRKDFSFYYGEANNLHWVDNFHTAYVLDSILHYIKSTGDHRHKDNLLNGYKFWKNTFFLEDGTPKYYHDKILPLDIQCASQAIETLVFFSGFDYNSIDLAIKVAGWTIDNMQDKSGYFYYRRYNRVIVNKTPTLHWGQATMLCALAGLYKKL